MPPSHDGGRPGGPGARLALDPSLVNLWSMLDRSGLRLWVRFTLRFVAPALALLALALGFVAERVVRSAAENRVFDDPEQIPARDVAIVPGSLVLKGGRPSRVVEDRLEGALALYRTGKVRKVLVSGDHGRTSYDEVNVMADWLFRHGVPETDVFLDHAGFRTLDTMMRAARIFGVHSAVVCSQRFHLPRSLFLALRSNVDAIGLVVDRNAYPYAMLARAREHLAVAKAVLDSYVLRRGPRFWGPEIPIHGDGRVTQDRS